MTGITAITRDWGDNVSIVRITTTSTLSQASAAGYITAQHSNIVAANNGEFEWLASDMCLVYASDGWMFANISSDFTALEPMVFSTTVVGAPVTVGDFAVFASTGGNIEDLGYLPSNAAKTRVVMAGSSTTAGLIAHFVDTTGTIDDTAGVVSNLGGIYAGASGTAGVLRSYPSAATSGYFGLTGVANAADYAVQISNASHGQATTYVITDAGNANGRILNAATATPFVSGNLPAASGTGGLMVDSGTPANALKYASVAISAAEFNGMYEAPKLLIAAPGANNLIVVSQIDLIMTYNANAFAAGGVVAAQYDNTVHGAGVLATNSEAAADFAAAASTTFQFTGTSGNTVGALPFSTTVNKGLYLSNATGAFTTGDSTFVAKIFYRIVATA